MKLCEFPKDQAWTLVYSATEHGFGFADFHKRSSKKRNCLTIIKSENGNIFGGYTDAAWNEDNNHVYDDKAFLFSLINKDGTPLKMECCDPQHAILGYPSSCLQRYSSFGRRDLVLWEHSNINTNSYSDLGSSYKHPKYPLGSAEAMSFLAGTHQFKTSEIEMYSKQVYNGDFAYD